MTFEKITIQDTYTNKETNEEVIVEKDITNDLNTIEPIWDEEKGILTYNIPDGCNFDYQQLADISNNPWCKGVKVYSNCKINPNRRIKKNKKRKRNKRKKRRN